MGLIETKTWSQMINEKIPKVIPKTIITTPPGGEPESVNVWELMEDLEDINLLASPHRNKDKVILYFTSPRGVRKTYEDCCRVQMILKGLGVKIDERDVSMHAGFKKELKEMDENGQLEKVVESCESVENGVCESCGDVRLVPCETCYGSCKIYYEAEYDEEDECGSQRCPDCNENGLIQCPICGD
ncbi:hypothetical protein RDI58_004625 [Solanum bulbocastanum]|uniref:Glutaredoxin domain-containing protein n=1 Tax=Solanum bulbocastanum TaxID=147425 RepID=A0AAN8U247_SOLBU